MVTAGISFSKSFSSLISSGDLRQYWFRSCSVSNIPRCYTLHIPTHLTSRKRHHAQGLVVQVAKDEQEEGGAEKGGGKQAEVRERF